MWQSSKAHPAAYCPPGSICGMLSIPRALPPVTHGSALQAPECMWFLYYHGFNGLDGLDGFTVRGDCALMRPIGLT